MDHELLAHLEGMESRLREHVTGRIAESEARLEGRIAESEARLEDHVRVRIAETEARLREHTEIVETRLLGAFSKWARIAEIKGRVGEANVMGLGERMSALEDRLSDLERRRAS